MRATIRDVARRANVSVGTISNALTGKRPVAEATRLRIMAAIDELGYQPNLLARGLVNQRSYVLSAVVTETSDLGFYGYSSVLAGIQQAADVLGYSLMLHFVDSTSTSAVMDLLGQIHARKVDGILWAIHEAGGNREWVEAFQPEQSPPIVFLHMHPDSRLNVVSIDNQLGASLAVTHLAERGARTIGIITGPLDWWESRARLAGWRSALERCGLEADPDLIVEGNWLADSGQAGLETLLTRRPDLDAVFACNDSMALGAIHTACAHSLSIPDDMLLVGYDDTPEAAAYWPPLTSVNQGLSHSGKVAVEELQRLIDACEAGEAALAPRQQVLQPILIVRQSSLMR
jgi:LacI family transcriptional regulator